MIERLLRQIARPMRAEAQLAARRGRRPFIRNSTTHANSIQADSGHIPASLNINRLWLLPS